MFQPTKTSLFITEIISNRLFASSHSLLLSATHFLFLLCYKSYFAPYINIGLKLTHNILSFFVDTFRGLVTGRKGEVPYCMAHAITLIVVFFSQLRLLNGI